QVQTKRDNVPGVGRMLAYGRVHKLSFGGHGRINNARKKEQRDCEKSQRNWFAPERTDILISHFHTTLL
ncbi:MAG TPA: hypothetical protein PLO51_02100, partial [Candidatus Micrarchaeota archaeon]|nr:hypothetical protein [Candidatus Micrarchaeota archaeon]